VLIFACFVVVIVCGALAATREYVMTLLQLTELQLTEFRIFFVGVFLVANDGKALQTAVIIFRPSDKNTG